MTNITDNVVVAPDVTVEASDWGVAKLDVSVGALDEMYDTLDREDAITFEVCLNTI